MTTFSSSSYWDKRYKTGGNSGSGSYGRLAKFKAKVLNKFVKKHQIKTVLEIGVGDGNQLSLAKYPHYVGADVSEEAVSLCEGKFKGDDSKEFKIIGKEPLPKAELVLSLDVIFHLVENNVFERYMNQLFDLAEEFVIIYSSNKSSSEDVVDHVRHRVFTDWIAANRPNWNLIKKIDNKYPFDESKPKNTSFSDFYIYSKSVS